MIYLRIIGWYLILVVFVLLALSVNQIKNHNPADLSFLFALPFAFGLIFLKRWALWGTGILGICITCLMLGFTIVDSVLNLRGLTVGLGPFVLTEPKSIHLWLFAIATIIFIGLPMSSILIPMCRIEKNKR